MFDSRVLFTALVALVGLQRLGELALARRNAEWLRARGAHEVGAGHYPWMVALHTGFLLAAPLEVWWLGTALRPLLAAVMLAVLLLATGLRYWAIRTLGRRWTTRVLVLPGASRIRGGPYRFADHPNYAAVVLEIFALPLIHGAWRTAAVFTVLNAALLTVRLREEERALGEISSPEA